MGTDVIEYHATDSDAIEVIPILSGQEDNIARPGSPEAVDDDTMKPFTDAQNTSDQSGLSIASEVGNFEESFAEENDIDIASSDSDLVTKKEPSSYSESLQENSSLSLSSHDALVEDSKEDLVSDSFADQECNVSSSLIISRSKRRRLQRKGKLKTKAHSNNQNSGYETSIAGSDFDIQGVSLIKDEISTDRLQDSDAFPNEWDIKYSDNELNSEENQDNAAEPEAFGELNRDTESDFSLIRTRSIEIVQTEILQPSNDTLINKEPKLTDEKEALDKQMNEIMRKRQTFKKSSNDSEIALSKSLSEYEEEYPGILLLSEEEKSSMDNFDVEMKNKTIDLRNITEKS